MKYNELGKTGLKVSVIGFGGIPIQRGNVDEAKKVVQKAEELGINFIDTARGYTISEEYIGEALFNRRDKWIIATKSMVRDKDGMIKEVQTSLKNLKTNYIDLYQIHNVKDMDQYNKVMSADGAYNALIQLRDEGKIGHIGITSHSLDILKVALESRKFETIMYPYNIVENQALELFKRAKELNVGVIAMKPMAGGAITNGTLALKYILENNCINSAIPGMGSVEEVIENSKVGNNIEGLTVKETQEVQKISKELGTEFCRRCGYCAPCTQGIDIPSIFLFQAYKERYNLTKWAEERYDSLKANAADCIECGACESRCPYNLPIREMLKKAKVIFK